MDAVKRLLAEIEARDAKVAVHYSQMAYDMLDEVPEGHPSRPAVGALVLGVLRQVLEEADNADG